MNIVVIPVYRRPALLAATLRTIQATDWACYQRYLFSIDRQAYRANDLVIDTFACTNKGIVRRNHTNPGYTFNILEAMKSAATQLKPTDLVYIVADDVLVADDFFSFHEDAHALDPQAWFVSSTRGPRKILSNTVDEMVYRGPFTDLRAVSFPAWRVAAIVEHATRDYYMRPSNYCSKFLDTGHPVMDADIKGLIRRVMSITGGTGIYPAVPRACHVGWVGINRGGHKAIDSAFDARNWKADADQIMSMSTDQLNMLAQPEYRDIERCELIRARTDLRLI